MLENTCILLWTGSTQSVHCDIFSLRCQCCDSDCDTHLYGNVAPTDWLIFASAIQQKSIIYREHAEKNISFENSWKTCLYNILQMCAFYFKELAFLEWFKLRSSYDSAPWDTQNNLKRPHAWSHTLPWVVFIFVVIIFIVILAHYI